MLVLTNTRAVLPRKTSGTCSENKYAIALVTAVVATTENDGRISAFRCGECLGLLQTQ
jgi:hypothetical protein